MEYITSIKEIGKFQKELGISSILSVDTETTGLDVWMDSLLLLQVKTYDETFVFDCEKLGENNISYIVSLIESSGKLVLFHNAKFDLKFLKQKTGVMIHNVYDTMLAEILIYQGVNGENKFPSLYQVVEKYCGVKLNKEVRESFYKDFKGVTQEQIIYAVEDVAYLEKVREKQLAEINRTKQEKVLELEMKLVPVVSDMELNGILLDKAVWLQLSDISKDNREKSSVDLYEKIWQDIISVSTQKTALELFDLLKVQVKTKKDKALFESITDLDTIKEYFLERFNLNSPSQIFALLTNIYGIKDLPSTNEKDLVKLVPKYPIIADIVSYRGLSKSVTSFGENYFEYINPATGRIHTTLNQLRADTGRFSSSSPNLQNIKRESEYRNAFVAEKGYKLISCDYSQQEYRLCGSITKEPAIIQAYKSGMDMHTMTASKVFHVEPYQVTKEQRNKAKGYNFGILYGANKFGLSYALGCTVDEADEIITAFFAGYPVLSKVKNMIVNLVWKNKYSSTLLGRKRFFENQTMFSDDKELQKYRRKLEKEGFNHVVQGSGADVTKLALCKIYYENPFGSDLKLVLTVHDEIICEAKEEIALQAKDFMIKCMEEVEQEFLGEIPALAEGRISSCWEH